ncbi:MAG: FtsB family cell division protein [Nannocystaceae bacterium]|nr:septum formation initiator family protein [bacterium]
MHWLNRILLAVLVAGVIAVAPRQFKAASDNDDLTRVLEEKAALIETNAALQSDIELLRAEVSALKGDRAEVARIAREDLNLVMPGEVVFEVDYEHSGGDR